MHSRMICRQQSKVAEAQSAPLGPSIQGNSEAMAEFRGCFKEVGKPVDGGLLDLGDYLVLAAPNRYRKDTTDVIARQLVEFPYPNPIGIEFVLFDCYLAWEKS